MSKSKIVKFKAPIIECGEKTCHPCRYTVFPDWVPPFCAVFGSPLTAKTDWLNDKRKLDRCIECLDWEEHEGRYEQA